ncbi:MAG: TIGR03960 family B12-binding radical SAM protein [Candidatus Omnitrophota bacterium]|nr:TIGR03960 family B12-binding radical SAM protein [Candidatus Omnitrophota bacterium]
MDNLNELLLQVRKPARYIGGEWNMVKKEWAADKVKVLLAFPEVYEVGMSYLGLKILYGILNKRDDCLCERVFSPWTDFEEILRKNKIDLFSLESRKPLKEFDIIGISLAYELNYTNVLNLLDLGGVPIKSSDRGEDHPIVIAGGPASFNPEPMSEFIDAFVIGDGEEAIGELIDTYKASKGQSVKVPRVKLLREIAKIPGVYVPSLYEVAYNDDGTIKSFLPKDKDLPQRIQKRVVKDLDSSFYPTDQLVPYIQIVHDRIMLEIMRGCKHACKFCQAGTTYRPRRERSKETIVRIAKEAYSKTGYDEITLLSLSSGDHSHIREIMEELNKEFKEKGVSISVPSLRIEDILSKLPALISHVKKSGLTFAPEAGSECLRKVISKNIDIEKLMEALRESYRSGWRRVKLYFMIGLPTEKDEDLENIAKLLYKVSNLKREIDGKDAQVTASINAFVPKPHTPFQWEPMESIDNLSRKKNFLRSNVKSRMVEMDFNSFHTGYLEAVLARGDRRLSAVIYEAWKRGSRFDGWKECFNFNLWLGSFKDNGLDPDFYASRRRSPDEVLPWNFIDIGFNISPHVDNSVSV